VAKLLARLFRGRDQVGDFVEGNSDRKLVYRLIKELWHSQTIALSCDFATNTAMRKANGFVPMVMKSDKVLVGCFCAGA